MPPQTQIQMLANGTRPESWTSRDKPYLVKCRNRRPTPDGLIDFFSFTAPVSDAAITGASEVKAWPSPQFFQGRSIWLLAFSDALYTVNVSTGAITLVDTKDPDDATGTTSKAITEGLDWHFMDMGTTWMLFNTQCVIWQAHGGFVWVSDDVTINTGCTHLGGRAIMAGFNPSDFYSRADWPAYWAGLGGEIPSAYPGLTLSGMDTHWVRWGSILSPDLLDLLAPDDLMNTDMAVNLRWRREAGGAPMPWIGTCYGVVEFGGGFLCYGTGGVTYLAAFRKGYSPFPVEGMGENVGMGISGSAETRTHWAGTKRLQFFVDASTELWVIEAGERAAATLLGHKESLSLLNRDRLVVTYDATNKQVYFADGARCFLLSDGRMCEAPWMPTTIYAASRSVIRAITFNATDPTTVEVETGTFTTQSGHIETWTGVYLKGRMINASTGWRVKVKYRTRCYDDWVTSSEITPDARGIATGAIPVLEWRYVFTSTDQTKVTMQDFGHIFDGGKPGNSQRIGATPSTSTE